MSAPPILLELSVVELHELWSSAWDDAHRRPAKKATPEKVAAVEASAAYARDLIDRIDAEMQRRKRLYVAMAGSARIEAIRNPYEGFTNGLWEHFREGVAAYLVGVSEAEAMAHHCVYFREAYHVAAAYVTQGKEPVGVLDDLYHKRPSGTPHPELAPEPDLFTPLFSGAAA
jgi:hypothetical protein